MYFFVALQLAKRMHWMLVGNAYVAMYSTTSVRTTRHTLALILSMVLPPYPPILAQALRARVDQAAWQRRALFGHLSLGSY